MDPGPRDSRVQAFPCPAGPLVFPTEDPSPPPAPTLAHLCAFLLHLQPRPHDVQVRVAAGPWLCTPTPTAAVYPSIWSGKVWPTQGQMPTLEFSSSSGPWDTRMHVYTSLSEASSFSLPTACPRPGPPSAQLDHCNSLLAALPPCQHLQALPASPLWS